MSETPRLSRRELRELGKLDALPEQETDLSETAELKLRRPSRKELREAAERERAEMEARQKADEAPEDAGEAAPDQADEQAAEAPAERVDEPADEPADERTEEPAEAPVEEPSSDVADDEPTQAMDAVVGDHGDEQTPEASDGAESLDGATAEETEQLSDAHQRKSVFDRFEDSTSKVEPRDGDDTVAPAPESAPEPEHADGESATEIDGDEDVPLRDRFLAMTSKDDRAQAVQPETEADAGGGDVSAQTQAMVTPATAVSVDESDSQAVAAGNDQPGAELEDEYDDVEVESPKRRWLMPLFVIVLGLLVGYLGGSWINKNYLSESVPYVVTETVNLLL